MGARLQASSIRTPSLAAAGVGSLIMRARLNSLPLFWRVFGTNAAVLVLAFLALVFAPVTVSVPPQRSSWSCSRRA